MYIWRKHIEHLKNADEKDRAQAAPDEQRANRGAAGQPAKVGEIFTGSYKTEYSMLKRLYDDYPGLGRICVFRNHSKIMAGIGAKFAFGIQTSANINTNPRTEQACITIDRGLYDFYKNYFDGINSFE